MLLANAKKHYLALILAFLAGLIFLAPHLFFMSSPENNYQGVALTPRDAEPHYLSIVNDVVQGYPAHNSPFLYEYKSVRSPLLEYSESVYGLLIRFLGISPAAFYLLAQFVFPVIIFLSWYYFCLLLFGRKKTAVLSGLFLLFGYFILSHPSFSGQINILVGRSSDVSLLPYGRFANPLLSYPFFFLGLISIYQLFFRPDRKRAIIAGLILGLNFYVYFYFWSYLLVLLGLLILLGLAKKDRPAVRYFLLSLAAALVVGAYFFVDVLGVLFNSTAAATGGTLSPYVASHSPVFPALILLGSVLFGAFIYFDRAKTKINDRRTVFMFLLAVSSVVVVNQQVVTGKSIEPGHWHWYVNIPVFWLLASFVIAELLERIKPKMIGQGLFALLCLYLIAFGLGTQASGYQNSLAAFRYYQHYGPVFAWLNQNTPKESVVLADDDFSDLARAYTHNNVYYAPHAVYDGSNPLDRRIHSAFVYYFLEGDKAKVLGRVYSFTVLGPCHDSGCVGSPIFNSLMAKYPSFAQTPFLASVKKYRADYLVWDRAKDPEWPIGQIGGLRELETFGKITVYQIP